MGFISIPQSLKNYLTDWHEIYITTQLHSNDCLTCPTQLPSQFFRCFSCTVGSGLLLLQFLYYPLYRFCLIYFFFLFILSDCYNYCIIASL